MILRRIIKHFRNQEWTAIALIFSSSWLVCLLVCKFPIGVMQNKTGATKPSLFMHSMQKL